MAQHRQNSAFGGPCQIQKRKCRKVYTCSCTKVQGYSDIEQKRFLSVKLKRIDDIFDTLKCDFKVELPSLNMVTRSRNSRFSHFCGLCNQTFSCQTQLKSHMLQLHGQKTPAADDNKQILPKQQNTKVSRKRLKVYDDSSGEGDDDSSVTMKREKMNKLSPNTHQCEKCAAVFFTYNSFNAHSRVHEQKFPFACTICLAAFSLPADLKEHMSLHILGVLPMAKVWTCSNCRETFHSLDEFKAHWFGSLQEQEQHVIHRCYLCHICNLAFTTALYWRKHRAVFHHIVFQGLEWSKSKWLLKCEQCDKMFDNFCAFRAHRCGVIRRKSHHAEFAQRSGVAVDSSNTNVCPSEADTNSNTNSLVSCRSRLRDILVAQDDALPTSKFSVLHRAKSPPQTTSHTVPEKPAGQSVGKTTPAVQKQGALAPDDNSVQSASTLYYYRLPC